MFTNADFAPTDYAICELQISMDITTFTRRGPNSAFFGGQERVGAILLIGLAAISISALAAILIVQRRNTRPAEAIPLIAFHQRRKIEDLIDKPEIHDLYIGRPSNTRRMSWSTSLVKFYSSFEYQFHIYGCVQNIAYICWITLFISDV
jgi:hypothetical protein